MVVYKMCAVMEWEHLDSSIDSPIIQLVYWYTFEGNKRRSSYYIINVLLCLDPTPVLGFFNNMRATQCAAPTSKSQ